MKCGIYKITNILNGKTYIGQSINIEKRWEQHKYEAFNKNQQQYNYTLHRAFRKYGLNNFSFDVLEECLEEQLDKKEIYWIKFFDCYHDGYNETEGGDKGPSLKGESNPNSKLTKEDVVLIRMSLLQDKTQQETYKMFVDKISFRQFCRIWQGEGWEDVVPEAIQYVKSKEYISKIRSRAAQSRLSAERIQIRKEILQRKEKQEKRLEVYEDYKDIYSLSGFNKVWYSKKEEL